MVDMPNQQMQCHGGKAHSTLVMPRCSDEELLDDGLPQIGVPSPKLEFNASPHTTTTTTTTKVQINQACKQKSPSLNTHLSLFKHEF